MRFANASVFLFQELTAVYINKSFGKEYFTAIMRIIKIKTGDERMRKGDQTVVFDAPPVIISAAAVAGKMEGEGPLANDFDMIVSDDKMGEESWDMAEAKLQETAVELALKKAGANPEDINYLFAGDLQNQCAAAHYGLRDTGIPFFGLYGACSTMTESLSLGAMVTGAGFSEKTLCATSSHFCTAEKQFRTPLNYGGQRTPSSQWTVTASGAAVLATHGEGPRITGITTGRIIDRGVTDANNMGAAMAPAAIDTIAAHFRDTGLRPEYYDLILTGDLGIVGSAILCELIMEEGFDISAVHNDCGKMIFNIDEQDVHAGGSGCGCCASVLCGSIYKGLCGGKYKRVLVTATGALMNTVALGQGESIPAIAHAVAIEI